MAKKIPKKKIKPNVDLNLQLKLREGFNILILALTLFFTIALLTYNPQDPAWSTTGFYAKPQNATGIIGAIVADLSFYFVGYTAYLLPLVLGWSVGVNLWNHFKQAKKSANFLVSTLNCVGITLIFFSADGLVAVIKHSQTKFPMGAGGVLGNCVSKFCLHNMNFFGSILLLCTSLLIGLTLVLNLPWRKLISGMQNLIHCWAKIMRKKIPKYWHKLLKACTFSKKTSKNEKSLAATRFLLATETKAPTSGKGRILEAVMEPRRPTAQVVDVIDESTGEILSNSYDSLAKTDPRPRQNAIREKSPVVTAEPDLSSNLIKPAPKPRPSQTTKTAQAMAGDTNLPEFPSLEILDEIESTDYHYSEQALMQMSRLVEEKLADFGVKAEVVAVQPGPVIVRFELQLAPGIKASKVTGLAKDLARAMMVVSVRVVEVIPGKPHVGLELPNRRREIVSLKAVLNSSAYSESKSSLSLVLGKDIAGAPVVVDLAKMPHLLVAGTTGSGKSVGLNVMILSLLYKSTPEDLRILMIDPKMLELSVYEGIPHLLAPVVTDMKDAANALRWCVAEMERRYQLMATLGVRNLVGYNRKVLDAANAGSPLKDPLCDDEIAAPLLNKLPHIVVIIDEFADMMMVVGKKVEELIARIAQKARAAGIHMILATQRPSVDVITGLIKANIPTRIAFQVSSRIDSRTILDQQGAEQLLGQGDMLYLPPGTGVPIRVHGAFVDDHEVHAVVAEWKKRGTPNFQEEILTKKIDIAGMPKLAIDQEDGEGDPLYDEAVQFVLKSRKASISSVQRRFKIGYNRAARIIEEMENAGIVGPMQNSGGRDILVTGHGELD